MDFALTDDQRLVRQAIREFCDREIAPRSAGYNERREFPWQNFRELGRLGYLNLHLPAAHGGGGADWITYAIVIEELARACAATAVIYEVHCSLVSEAIHAHGTAAQQATYLPRLSAGDLLGAYALTEPGAGSDAAALQTRAERRGDTYVLNGQKCFITSGGVADLYVVFARLANGPATGPEGITAFLVAKGSPGLEFGPPERKMGLHASPTTSVYLADCPVPLADRLGTEGGGYDIALSLLQSGRIGIAAQAVGIAQAALEAGLAYAQERHTFGRPIARHQAIAFKLADMATEIDAARLLLYRAAFLKGSGRPAEKEIAMAKLFASEVAMRQTVEAVQVFGGYGYMEDYKVERLMREAKVTQIYEGTSEIQRLIISRQLLKAALAPTRV